MRHRFVAASVIFVAAASCAPPAATAPRTTAPAVTAPPTTAPPTTSPAPNAPVISAFTASTTTGTSPLTTALNYAVSSPNGAALVCSLDLDNNGSADVTITPCTSGSRTRSFTTPGVHHVTLYVSNGSASATAALDLTVGAASADPFDITVRTNGSMTSTQLAAFTSAAAKWQSIVRSGLSSAAVNFPADYCGTGAPAFSGTIDDLLIDATITTMDGPGRTLGQAGWCVARGGNGLPIYGVMKFDVADVPSLEASGMLDETIVHEMGHVLGFGTLWPGGVFSGAGTTDPRFNGPASVGAWNELGGSGGVPVENGGGPGTADAHWRESVFGNELMTGWLDASAPLSRLTAASLADIGYGVNTAAADPYTRPSALRVLSLKVPPPGEMIDVEPQESI